MVAAIAALIDFADLGVGVAFVVGDGVRGDRSDPRW